MNNIIQKCIDELNKEQPKLDYIRGMLETVLEMQAVKQVITMPAVGIGAATAPGPIAPAPQDEAALLDAKARAAIGTVKALSELSTETA